MYLFHLKSRYANRSYLLKLFLVLFISLSASLLLIKSPSLRYQEALEGAKLTAKNNESAANMSQFVIDEYPKDVKEPLEHLRRFAIAVVQMEVAFEQKDLALYLAKAKSANEEGIDVWIDNPGHTAYPSSLSKYYHISLETAGTIINRQFYNRAHQWQYYQSRMPDLQWEDILRASPLEWMGMEELVSYFGIILFFVPVLLLPDIVLGERTASEVLRRLPISSDRYIFGKAIVEWGIVFSVQLLGIILFFSVQLISHNMERLDVPYVFISATEEWTETLVTLSWKIVLMMGIADLFLVSLAVLLNIVTRSIIVTQLGLLVTICWEMIEIFLNRHLWESAWNFLYYFDIIPALNGSKALLYQQDNFGLSSGVLSFIITTSIVVIFIEGYLFIWNSRKGGRHELIPF